MIPRDHRPPATRTSLRMDARLDATTRAKVDDLAKRFHQPRAAVLSSIMEWALSRGQAATRDGGEAEGPVCHLYLYVDTALHARVEQVASAAGMKIAPWLRAMVRQITIMDFPASWHAVVQHPTTPSTRMRSQTSRHYDTPLMLRLDQPARGKLQGFVEHFGVSKAAVIRQLIAQSNAEDFPTSWHLRAAECRAREARREPPLPPA
jgi:hypothetical protein